MLEAAIILEVVLGKYVEAAIIATLLASAVGLLAPWPLSFLIDSVLGNHPPPHFMQRLFGLKPENRYGMLYFAVSAGSPSPRPATCSTCSTTTSRPSSSR